MLTDSETTISIIYSVLQTKMTFYQLQCLKSRFDRPPLSWSLAKRCGSLLVMHDIDSVFYYPQEQAANARITTCQANTTPISRKVEFGNVTLPTVVL